jgi:hypothetical protein
MHYILGIVLFDYFKHLPLQSLLILETTKGPLIKSDWKT